ncbi:MAG: hypothetical protein U9Q97_05200 [Acidobacteriota bacterium]|nr:hypothetical protein [Acidobacteriota bacterium]
MEYSILNASNDFADLSNNIGRFKEELCKAQDISFESNDFRLIALDSIQQCLLSLTAYIRGFMGLQEKINNEGEFLKFLNLGVTKEQMEGEEGKPGLIYKFPIECLVTMIHFHIDSYFGQICALKEDTKAGFYNRMTKVIENISEKEKFQNTFQCLANIRNSFHNKGIHSINENKWENNNEPSKGTIDRTFESGEFKIEFKHNEVISYNWKSMYLLIKKSVEILEKIISDNSENIKDEKFKNKIHH